MNKERDLLMRVKVLLECVDTAPLQDQAEQEQEPVTDKPTETAMAVMPNGVCVSNVYDAYEEGRKSVMSEQEPVAWIYEWVDEAGEPVKSVAYNFYDDANPIPLYTAPPKREPLSTKQAEDLWETTFKSAVPYYIFDEICTAIEQYHGIVGGE